MLLGVTVYTRKYEGGVGPCIPTRTHVVVKSLEICEARNARPVANEPGGTCASCARWFE